MDSRISQLTLNEAVGRQTARVEFGAVLSRTLGTAATAVASTVGGGVPILSAALSAIARTGETVQTLAAQAKGAPDGALAAGRGEGWDLLDAQKAMQADGRSFNMQYLALQEKIQRESREYTTVTNIMKVRHDSAKSAINNIR